MLQQGKGVKECSSTREEAVSALPTAKANSPLVRIGRALRTAYLFSALLYASWHLFSISLSWHSVRPTPSGTYAPALVSGTGDTVVSATAVGLGEEPPVLSWPEWGQLHGVEWDKDVLEWKTQRVARNDKDTTFVATEDHFLSKAFGDSLQPSKVIPYYYRATNDPNPEDITITTLVTSDRFKVLAALVRKYQGQCRVLNLLKLWLMLSSDTGPISVTIHVSNNAPTRTQLLQDLHELYTTSPFMSAFVDVHLVIDSFDRQFNMWRNVARYFARTDYIMMLDVDFAICTNFRDRILNSPQVVSKLKEGQAAFVVPAFEYAKQSDGRDPSKFPSSKQELLNLVEQEKIGMFHKSWAPGHGSTNYTKYYSAQSGEVYKVNSYTYAYEPYVIFKKEGTPFCDERFIGYGAK